MQAWGGTAWGQQAEGPGQGAGEGGWCRMEKHSEDRGRNLRDEGRRLRSFASDGRDLDFVWRRAEGQSGTAEAAPGGKALSQRFWERQASKGRADSRR